MSDDFDPAAMAARNTLLMAKLGDAREVLRTARAYIIRRGLSGPHKHRVLDLIDRVLDETRNA
jgi:hypothetical protein